MSLPSHTVLCRPFGFSYSSNRGYCIDDEILTGVWVGVVATIDGTTMNIYKNGALTDTNTGDELILRPALTIIGRDRVPTFSRAPLLTCVSGTA